MSEMGKISYLVMDVDGTLTDGKVYIGENGELFKAFNIKDGYGIRNIIRKNNISTAIITGRESKMVIERCTELGIANIHQNVLDKSKELEKITDELNKIAYIGDDLNDLECMQLIKKAGGILGCPANAVKEIVSICDFVSEYNGGDGAVREFIEWIVQNN